MRIPQSKIAVPALPGGFVARGHLLDRLDQATAGQLVVVIAPPGFGKTTLLSSWLGRPGGPPTAWISLDAADDVARFRTTLLAAVTELPDLAPNSPLRQVGRGEDDVAGLDVIDELIEAFHATTPTIRLVLDDLQELAAPQAMRDLARIIRSSPAGLQLVLSSRVDPPLRLPRLRLEGRLFELRAQELRFSEDDATALMRAAGLDVPPEQISVLHARTEGWAAGLRFAALALRTSENPQGFLARFSGSDQSVADYLTGEVMARLPTGSRRLLHVAAVCSELPVGLAVALTGRVDAGQMLDELVRGTALIQRMKPETYRIHTLLRTYLVTDLERQHPELYRRSQIIAAQWWLAADDPLHALRHAAQAAEPAVLQALLRQCGLRLLATGQLAAVQRALDAAGPLTAIADPWLALLKALVDSRYAASDAVAAVEQARRIWPPDPEPALAAFLTSVELLVADGPPTDAVLSLRHPTGAVPVELEVLLDLSVATASGGGDAADANALRARLESVAAISRECGFSYFEVWAQSLLAEHEMGRGRYDAMRSAARAAVAEAAVQGRQPAEWAAEAGALLAYGDLLAGEPMSAQVRAEAVLGAGSPLRPETEFTLRVVHATALADLGELASGLAACRAARATFGDAVLPARMLTALTLLEYWSATALGGPAVAAETCEWLEQRVGRVAETLLMDAWEHMFLGQYEAARAAVEPIAAGAVQVLIPHTPLEVHLVQAEAALHAEDREAGRTELAAALALGEALGVVRPFALAGGLTAEILRSAQPTGVGPRFAEQLSDAFAVVQVEMPAPLSERELAVLALLPSLLSGGEIADELTVSVNTVKSHIRSIYRKLGVSTRRDAVRRAQERRLIT
jgi:LuxR family transcriptional regulator, maltose regulon positive regulatory protein